MALRAAARASSARGVRSEPPVRQAKRNGPAPHLRSRPRPPLPRSKSFLGAVELLIELASLQTAFLTLDEAIKTTNRRVNALEHVVKPKLENTIAYIKARQRAAAARREREKGKRRPQRNAARGEGKRRPQRNAGNGAGRLAPGLRTMQLAEPPEATPQAPPEFPRPRRLVLLSRPSLRVSAAPSLSSYRIRAHAFPFGPPLSSLSPCHRRASLTSSSARSFSDSKRFRATRRRTRMPRSRALLKRAKRPTPRSSPRPTTKRWCSDSIPAVPSRSPSCRLLCKPVTKRLHGCTRRLHATAYAAAEGLRGERAGRRRAGDGHDGRGRRSAQRARASKSAGVDGLGWRGRRDQRGARDVPVWSSPGGKLYG